jgi:hypothetical protein
MIFHHYFEQILLPEPLSLKTLYAIGTPTDNSHSCPSKKQMPLIHASLFSLTKTPV